MGWLPLAMTVGGALLGNEKHRAQQAAEDADIQRAAATERYSPWTGMHAGAIRHPSGSQFGDIAGGAFGGFMAGNSLGGQPQAPAPEQAQPILYGRQSYAR